MKTSSIALLILSGAVLLVAGYLTGSFFSGPRPEGSSPDTIVKEWRGSAAGTIADVSESSITIEKDGARVSIGITQETEIAKSVINEGGVEQLTPITLQDLQKGDNASVAVILAKGRLRAAAIRVLEK